MLRFYIQPLCLTLKNGRKVILGECGLIKANIYRSGLQEESEAALLDARGLQEHLEEREHMLEGLRRELRELGTRQGHTHTELQQARLQAAQLALQLSEENLAHREELASWSLEREALKHVSEVRKPQRVRLSFVV